VTSGAIWGTSGEERRAFWRAFATLAVLMLAICLANTFTASQDRARSGHPIALWEPAVWEYTSGACILICVLVLYPPITWLVRRWTRWTPVILLAGLPVASLLHVSGMVALRHLIYAAVGGRYPLTLEDFPYEFRKDAITYALLTLMLWLWRRTALSRAAAVQPPATLRPGNDTLDIRDGARTLRVAVADIVSVSSAGNYVEFALADGRKPLMRSTLAAVEARLAPLGFLRTHRSWLINPARVRLIEPEGSGDYAVELDGGPRAPVSRRYPQALAQLRGDAG